MESRTVQATLNSLGFDNVSASGLTALTMHVDHRLRQVVQVRQAASGCVTGATRVDVILCMLSGVTGGRAADATLEARSVDS